MDTATFLNTLLVMAFILVILFYLTIVFFVWATWQLLKIRYASGVSSQKQIGQFFWGYCNGGVMVALIAGRGDLVPQVIGMCIVGYIAVKAIDALWAQRKSLLTKFFGFINGPESEAR